MLKIIIAITGASGSIYAKRLIQEVNQLDHQQIILISDPARDVLKHELDLQLPISVDRLAEVIADSWQLPYPGHISCVDINNYNVPIASGSQAAEVMVVIPCSMGSIARFNQGASSNLIERSFDVMLKERKKIIVVPRETPLNQIHLRNMLSLSQMGIDILPAMPAFYHQPQKLMDLVDFVVGRVLEHLGFNHSLYNKWEGF